MDYIDPAETRMAIFEKALEAHGFSYKRIEDCPGKLTAYFEVPNIPGVLWLEFSFSVTERVDIKFCNHIFTMFDPNRREQMLELMNQLNGASNNIWGAFEIEHYNNEINIVASLELTESQCGEVLFNIMNSMLGPYVYFIKQTYLAY